MPVVYQYRGRPNADDCGEIKLRKSRVNEGGKSENATRGRKDCLTIVFGCWLFSRLFFFSFVSRRGRCTYGESLVWDCRT